MSYFHNEVDRLLRIGLTYREIAQEIDRNENYVRQIVWQNKNRESYADQQRRQYERKKQCRG